MIQQTKWGRNALVSRSRWREEANHTHSPQCTVLVGWGGGLETLLVLAGVDLGDYLLQLALRLTLREVVHVVVLGRHPGNVIVNVNRRPTWEQSRLNFQLKMYSTVRNSVLFSDTKKQSMTMLLTNSASNDITLIQTHLHCQLDWAGKTSHDIIMCVH